MISVDLRASHRRLAEFVFRAGDRCEEAAPEIFLLSLRIYKVDQTNSVKQVRVQCQFRAVLKALPWVSRACSC